MIRILLADDQALIRGALAALLEMEGDLQVVAQADRGDQVLETVRAHRPDVALLDVEMPGADGIEAARQIAQSGLPCRSLIVTTFGRPGYLRRALEAGASGFVVKDMPAAELATVVRRVHQGLRVVDPAITEQSLVMGASPLTERETDVLRASELGQSLRHVAQAVFLSEGTVRNHLSSIIAKTQAANRYEAARIARENGWL